MQKRIGKYLIGERLGKGGMGDVFVATHEDTGSPVAMKILSDPAGSQQADRFLREVEMLASLQHPNLVRIHDRGSCDEGLYYCMEIVEGRTLREGLDDREGFETCRQALAQLCDALAYLAERAAVHRDLKPENVVIETETGKAKLIDFGLGKMLADERGLTATGQILGTPAYMAPEQLRGKEISPAADLFALGVMVYEWVAKRRPFLGKDVSEVLGALSAGSFIPLAMCSPYVSPELAALVDRALVADPAKRHVDLQALKAAVLAQEDFTHIASGTQVVSASSIRSQVEDRDGTREMSRVDGRRAVAPGKPRPSSESAPASVAMMPRRRNVPLVPAVILIAGLALWIVRWNRLPRPISPHPPTATARQERPLTEATLSWAVKQLGSASEGQEARKELERLSEKASDPLRSRALLYYLHDRPEALSAVAVSSVTTSALKVRELALHGYLAARTPGLADEVSTEAAVARLGHDLAGLKALHRLAGLDAIAFLADHAFTRWKATKTPAMRDAAHAFARHVITHGSLDQKGRAARIWVDLASGDRSLPFDRLVFERAIESLSSRPEYKDLEDSAWHCENRRAGHKITGQFR